MRLEIRTATPFFAMCSLLIGCAECTTSADCDFGEVCVSGSCEPRPASLGPIGDPGVNTGDGPQDSDSDNDDQGASLPTSTSAEYTSAPYEALLRGCLDDAYLPTNPAVFVDKEELLLFFTEPSSTAAYGLSLFMTRSRLDSLSFSPKEIVAFDAGPVDFVRNEKRTFIISGQDPNSAALFEGDDRAQNWSLRDTAASQSETTGVCSDEIAPRFLGPQNSALQMLVGFEDPAGVASCRYRTWFWDPTQKDLAPVASGHPAGAALFDDRLFAASTSDLTSAASTGGPFTAIDFDTALGQNRTFHRLISNGDRLYVLTSSLHGAGRDASLISAAGSDDWDTFIVFPDRPEDESKHLSRADIAVHDEFIAVAWLLEDSVALLTVSDDGGTTWSAPASFIVPVEGSAPRGLSLATDGDTVYGAFQMGGPPEREDTRICFAAFEPAGK